MDLGVEPLDLEGKWDTALKREAEPTKSPKSIWTPHSHSRYSFETIGVGFIRCQLVA